MGHPHLDGLIHSGAASSNPWGKGICHHHLSPVRSHPGRVQVLQTFGKNPLEAVPARRGVKVGWKIAGCEEAAE